MKQSRRFPLSPVAATIFAAAIVTTLLAIFASARVAEDRRSETARAQARLNETALRAEDVLSGMTQLLRVQIAVIAPSRRRSDVIDGVRRLKTTASRRLVFGIALAYAPYRFDSRTRDFGVYSRASDRSTDLVMVVDGFDSLDYEAADWFERARRAGDRRTFILPYQGRDDKTYVAAVQPFFSGHRFDGVALVDVKLATFRDLLAQSLEPADRIEIVDATGRVLWRTGAAPAAGEVSSEATLRAVPWSVRLTTAMPVVRQGAIVWWGVTCVVALLVWIGAGLAVRKLLLRRAARAEAAAHLGSVALQREIASRVAAEDRLRIAADQDSLTGLPNRRHVVNALTARVEGAKHAPGRSFAVFFIDLDRFAVINDSLGHSVGDVVLTMIAQRIAEALPDGALLARFGGDEFVVVSDVDRGRKSPAHVAARLVDAIREPLPLRDREINLTGSVGVVTGLGSYGDAEAMLRDADIAMYAAKDSGRGRYVLFDKRLREKAVTRLSLESRIRRGIRRREFVPHYQPVIELATGRVRSVEALARWESADGSGVSTSDFILAAEQSGLVAAIDADILRQTCRDATRMERIAPGIQFAVNMSATLFQQDGMLANLQSIIERSAVDPSRLKFELTETAIMERADEAVALLTRLRALGSDVVIDDFGMGYSSLSYVQRLPVSGLKIDRSFIAPIAPGNRSASIVRAIVALAQALGLHVTAEGVETEEQLETLREMNVDFVQGWYFSKALRYRDLEAFVTARNGQRYAVSAGTMG